jgi:MGT family glycosyltransferase
MFAFMDSIVVLQASKEALADEDVHVIMTTGHQKLPDELSPLPDNFRHELFLPGIPLGEKCELMIHHGGHGSSMTGVYTGTPAVIIPTISERESNARRLAALGVAEFIVPEIDESGDKKVSAKELRDKVRQVRSDPSFAQNAEKLCQTMRTYGGARQAAQLIEDFIRHV